LIWLELRIQEKHFCIYHSYTPRGTDKQ